jgi:HD superfamily phosphohydrolase YqeK
MTIKIHTISSKKIKLINKILIAGNYIFNEKEEELEKNDLTTEDFRSMIKNRRPQIMGKTLQKVF